jgi:VWFA-related protein
MPRIFVRLLLACFVSGALVLGQQPSYILKVDVPLVSVDITVQDNEGNLVNRLDPDTFEVYEDGVRQEIRNFSPVSTPYNVFLLFDRSGSTQHKWAFMQQAVAGFVASMRSQDRMAIATFDYKFESQLEWTGDRMKASRALSHLINPKGLGETTLYDSVERSLKRELRKVGGRRALVVLTDGRDTSVKSSAGVVGRSCFPEGPQGRPGRTRSHLHRGDQHGQEP